MTSSSLAPIVYYAYNRPQHTLQTLTALKKSRLSQQSELFIFIDGAKNNANSETLQNIEAVKSIAASEQWCGKLHIQIAEKNKGLFQSIVSGITETVNKYGKVIVIEDDVLVSPGFLEYMNNALDLYESEEKVMHISGFSRAEFSELPIKETSYFFNHTTCWGWATWKRSWKFFNPNPYEVKEAVSKKGDIYRLNMDGTFEFFWGLKAIGDGKFQSWNTIWQSIVFLNDGFCLHPTVSQVSNIGHDGSGTNCVSDDSFGLNQLSNEPVVLSKIPIEESKLIRNYNRTKLHSFKYRLIFAAKHYLRYIFWR